MRRAGSEVLIGKVGTHRADDVIEQLDQSATESGGLGCRLFLTTRNQLKFTRYAYALQARTRSSLHVNKAEHSQNAYAILYYTTNATLHFTKV